MMEPGLRGEEGSKGAGGGVKIIGVSDDTYFPPQTWHFPEVGEEDLQDIIQKLEAGDWRSTNQITLLSHKSGRRTVTFQWKIVLSVQSLQCPLSLRLPPLPQTLVPDLM